MVDFGQSCDWNAMAHVRFLRAQGGASSGYTADLIEKLYEALVRDRGNLRHWREQCGKLHAKIAESDHVNEQLRQRLGLGEAENERLERVIKKLQADLLAWEITAKRIEREEASRTQALLHDSDGGSRKLPFDPADAAGVNTGSVCEKTGKQEGRTGFEIGALQTPGSSMSFGSDKPITAGQASGPSDTFSLLHEEGQRG